MVLIFCPRAAAFAAFDDPTSGFENVCTAFWMSSVEAWQPSPQHDVLDLVLEQVAARQPVGEERVVVDLLALQLASSLGDFDVPGDRVHEARHAERREVRADLFPERAHEFLLARDAVEVGVGVPVADEVECLLPVETLVTGLQVDVREVVVRGAGVSVVVAAVDVHPDAAELVDDLLETVEIDRDQVVDG